MARTLIIWVLFLSVSDPDSVRSMDPDPGGQKNDPQKYKKVKKVHVLKCWVFSFFRAEGFSCSLDALYGGLGISK
jgi:hypothetical protein